MLCMPVLFSHNKKFVSFGCLVLHDKIEQGSEKKKLGSLPQTGPEREVNEWINYYYYYLHNIKHERDMELIFHDRGC